MVDLRLATVMGHGGLGRERVMLCMPVDGRYQFEASKR
jgi:hypothetical protein